MANTDEQQYNGTQYFPPTADVGTNADIFLIPTDGPVITADSNNTDEAPVNLALKKAKDWLLGLRGALVGDFVGAVRKTVYNLSADGVGGQPNAAGAGEVVASNDIRSTNGAVTAKFAVTSTNGAVVSKPGTVLAGDVGSGSYSFFTQAFHRWLGTAASGANPPQGTSIKNELDAINVPKCSCYVDMQGAGVINSFDGYGIASAVIDITGTFIKLTFVDAFDNAHFTVKPSCVFVGTIPYLVGEIPGGRTTTSCNIRAWNLNTAAVVDFTVTPLSFSVNIDGKQTT